LSQTGGRIAVRIIRAVHDLELEAVAVYSTADAEALHVRMADDAVEIGPPPAGRSYLDIAKMVDAARATGAEAVHPGYGFLAERSDFARACEDAGLSFVGPRSEHIALMGDKARARGGGSGLRRAHDPGQRRRRGRRRWCGRRRFGDWLPSRG